MLIIAVCVEKANTQFNPPHAFAVVLGMALLNLHINRNLHVHITRNLALQHEASMQDI